MTAGAIVAPLAATAIQGRQQRKAERAKQAEIKAGEVKSQGAFRDALRVSGSGKGSGDFGAQSGVDPTGGFDAALKQVTGR